ncbi:MAG: IMP dehydrogenase, partial [Oleiphilaceae bacterium]|nr:IMP dehydrogenase [Oleiphilaceae bacterium]
MLRIAQEALTFDDVLLIPGYSDILPNQVSLATRLTRNIELKIPLVSAAMDTVTEANLAIAMAQEGGIGIVHKNMSVEEQAATVKAVKKFESGVVKDPITVTPQTTVREVLQITSANRISGLPVVDGKDLVGIVTGRDIRFESRLDTPVSDIMTPKDKLVTVPEGESTDAIKDILHKHRIEKVLVVNDQFELKGLVTVKDIQKSQDFPNACKDQFGQLRVGAAVGTGDGTEDRVDALVKAG